MKKITEMIINEANDKFSHLNSSDFGLPALRKFPMVDANGVRMAGVHFGNCKESHKHELARNIMKKAKLFGVTIKNANILKYAGESVTPIVGTKMSTVIKTPAEPAKTTSTNNVLTQLGDKMKADIRAGKSSPLPTSDISTPKPSIVQSFKKIKMTTINDIETNLNEITGLSCNMSNIQSDSFNFKCGNISINVDLTKDGFELRTATAGSFNPLKDEDEYNRYIVMASLCKELKTGNKFDQIKQSLNDFSEADNKMDQYQDGTGKDDDEIEKFIHSKAGVEVPEVKAEPEVDEEISSFKSKFIDTIPNQLEKAKEEMTNLKRWQVREHNDIERYSRTKQTNLWKTSRKNLDRISNKIWKLESEIVAIRNGSAGVKKIIKDLGMSTYKYGTTAVRGYTPRSGGNYEFRGGNTIEVKTTMVNSFMDKLKKMGYRVTSVEGEKSHMITFSLKK